MKVTTAREQSEKDFRGDPLKVLFVSHDYMLGFKAGRLYERIVSDIESSKLVLSYRRQVDGLLAQNRRLRKPTPVPTGRFALKVGRITLTRRYKTSNEAQHARDIIYKPEQRSRVEVVEV